MCTTCTSRRNIGDEPYVRFRNLDLTTRPASRLRGRYSRSFSEMPSETKKTANSQVIKVKRLKLKKALVAHYNQIKMILFYSLGKQNYEN
jgi:hypothetical protein